MTVLRIIDANFNRAREALRVMEESARFLLNDAELCRALKELRHDLSAAVRRLSSDDAALLDRDTPGDVGTAIGTESESRRGDVAEVVRANARRLTEALRVLEEYGKLTPGFPRPAAGAGPCRGQGPDVDPDEGREEGRSIRDARTAEDAGNSPDIESLRYRAYELERRLMVRLGGGRPRGWSLCVLLSEGLCPEGDWRRVLRAVLEGAGERAERLCVQLREKSMDAGPMLERARRLVDVCRPRGVGVIVNDRPDVALAAGADGVHLGQSDLPLIEARRLVGRSLRIGVSTANIEQARAAVRDGADYLGLGPMFPTATKHKPWIAGPEYVRAFVAEFPHTPCLAIGGITPENVGRVLAAAAGGGPGGSAVAGVRRGVGVAVSSAVCAADDPAGAVRRLLDAIDRFTGAPIAGGEREA